MECSYHSGGRTHGQLWTPPPQIMGLYLSLMSHDAIFVEDVTMAMKYIFIIDINAYYCTHFNDTLPSAGFLFLFFCM